MRGGGVGRPPLWVALLTQLTSLHLRVAASVSHKPHSPAKPLSKAGWGQGAVALTASCQPEGRHKNLLFGQADRKKEFFTPSLMRFKSFN